MSADWVSLWSPGLQAVGGIVELAGALVLAYEWRQNNREVAGLIPLKMEDRWGNKVKISSLGPHEIDDDARALAAESYWKLVRSFDHENLYFLGFAIIVLGVMVQIGANGIAWAGAYGLLS